MKKEILPITVIVPFYSKVSFLIDALESIDTQSKAPERVIVVNDGSTEDLTAVKQSFPDFEFYLKENGGSASARNFGLNLVETKYVAFLDSDDLWTRNKLEVQYGYMICKGCAISHHSYQCFQKNPEELAEKRIDTSKYVGDVYAACFTSFRVHISTVMINAELLDDYRFPEDFRVGQDMEFFKMVAKRHNFFHVPECFSYFRLHGSNIGFNVTMQLQYRSKAWAVLGKEEKRNLPIAVQIAYIIFVFGDRITSPLKTIRLPLIYLFFGSGWVVLKLRTYLGGLSKSFVSSE